MSWSVKASEFANASVNPIRQVVDGIKATPNPDKKVIPLSIGDPTVFGNLGAAPEAVKAVQDAAAEGKFNGYPHCTGFAESRSAVAKYFGSEDAPLTADDVILTSGCSGAIEICVTAIASRGQNILVPCPGFPLYQTIAETRGVEVRHYNLDPNTNWEIDLGHLESLIDDNTVAVFVNNPSNPCGSVFSREHLLKILALCEKKKLPIIADEIYCDMTFEGSTFYPLASLTKTVPILSVGGIAKKFLVPGWRLGWILVHDRKEIFAKELRGALVKLTQIVLGANSIAQAALPAILNKVPESYHTEVRNTLQKQAFYCLEKLEATPGLKVVRPQGAMYVMVGIDPAQFSDIADDVQFSNALLSEESVFVLPGQCFKVPNYFRIVFCAPMDKLEEACARIAAFCKRHTKA